MFPPPLPSKEKIIQTSQQYWADFCRTLNPLLGWVIKKKNIAFRKAAQIRGWFVHHHSTASDDVKNIGAIIKVYALRKWAEYQPLIDKFSRWSIAVTTTASTLKTSIQVLPIILSVSAILAGGIPLIGFLIPDLFFTKLASNAFLIGISIFVGYLKYNELVARAGLDAMIEQNKETIATFEDRLQKLETAYEHIPSAQVEHITSDIDAPEASNDHATPQSSPSRKLRASI